MFPAICNNSTIINNNDNHNNNNNNNDNNKKLITFYIAPVSSFLIFLYSTTFFITQVYSTITLVFTDVSSRDFAYSGVPKGPCHEALLKLPRPNPIGAFVPQCEDDGYYSLHQMWGSTGQAWCVTRDGKEIEGTKTNPGEPSHDCNKGTVYHT